MIIQKVENSDQLSPLIKYKSSKQARYKLNK